MFFRPDVYKRQTVSMLSRAFNHMAFSLKEKIESEKQLLVEQRKNEEYEKLLSQARFLALQKMCIRDSTGRI